jgi:DNA-binding response OmpR family regulator
MCAEREWTSKRLLIIDDDIDLLMLLERILTGKGYVVDTAASLQEAEEIFYTFLPHLVLLDININGDDGRQLCWKFKSEMETSVKVLLMSGYDISTSRALIFKADDLLIKPLNTDYLLQKVEMHLYEQADGSY